MCQSHCFWFYICSSALFLQFLWYIEVGIWLRIGLGICNLEPLRLNQYERYALKRGPLSSSKRDTAFTLLCNDMVVPILFEAQIKQWLIVQSDTILWLWSRQYGMVTPVKSFCWVCARFVISFWFWVNAINVVLFDMKLQLNICILNSLFHWMFFGPLS